MIRYGMFDRCGPGESHQGGDKTAQGVSYIHIDVAHLRMDMLVTFTTEGLAFLYTSMATFSSGVSTARACAASCDDMGPESCSKRAAATAAAASGAEDARGRLGVVIMTGSTTGFAPCAASAARGRHRVALIQPLKVRELTGIACVPWKGLLHTGTFLDHIFLHLTISVRSISIRSGENEYKQSMGCVLLDSHQLEKALDV